MSGHTPWEDIKRKKLERLEDLANATNDFMCHCLVNGVPTNTEEIREFMGQHYDIFCEVLFEIPDNMLEEIPIERIEVINKLKELVKQ